jgi:glutamyl-tRNA synthetase
MNGQYLMRMPADEIYPHLVPFLGDAPPPLDELRGAIELNKSRGRTLRDIADLLQSYTIADEELEYDAEASKKHLKGDDLAERMRELHAALAAVEPFDVNTTEEALRQLAESHGVGAGKLIHPLRLALTGRGSSPPIFDVAVVLGKEKSLRRLQRLIDSLDAIAR